MLIDRILFLAIYITIGKVLLQGTIQFLSQHKVLANNYRSENIPIGLGLFLWIMLLVYLILIKVIDSIGMLTILNPYLRDIEQLYTYVISLTVITFIGWLDDTIGDKHVKGFSGHWNQWKNHHILTTGLLKAAITSVMALWIVMVVDGSILLAPVQFLLIILMTNTVNLLDLRPGRSLKAFFTIALVWIVFGYWQKGILYFLPILVATVLLFPKDLQGKVMLGDTGANFLGFALGFCLIVASPYWLQTAVLFVLVGIHWIAARSSITRIVKNNYILNWIDRWGRV